MATAPTVSIQVAPEAATHVAVLGMQRPFQQMLDHALQTIPGLQSLQVALQPPYDVGGGPCVLIEGIRDNPHRNDDPVDREFAFWQARQFPPEVFQHFTLLTYYGPNHAG